MPVYPAFFWEDRGLRDLPYWVVEDMDMDGEVIEDDDE